MAAELGWRLAQIETVGREGKSPWGSGRPERQAGRLSVTEPAGRQSGGASCG